MHTQKHSISLYSQLNNKSCPQAELAALMSPVYRSQVSLEVVSSHFQVPASQTVQLTKAEPGLRAISALFPETLWAQQNANLYQHS